MRSFFSLLCLPLVLVFAGCSTPPERRLDPPSLQVTGLTAAGDHYVLALRFFNSNAVPLVINHSTHTVYLGKQSIDRIDDRDPIGMPPLGGVEHKVTLAGKPAAEVRAWFAKNPGEVDVSVKSLLEVIIGYEDDDDTLKLTSAGRGTVKAP